MYCVDRIDCNKSRMIAKNVNAVTEEEAVFRFMACKKPDGGRGVCCQDPNYKDDWPTVPGTCDPPNVRFDDGRCVTPPTPPPGSCPPPLIKLLNGSCGCKPPKVLLPSGKCGTETTITTTPTPPDEKCKPPKVKLSDDKCGCKPPLVLLPNDKCGTETTITTTPTPPDEKCKPPKVLLPSGECGQNDTTIIVIPPPPTPTTTPTTPTGSPKTARDGECTTRNRQAKFAKASYNTTNFEAGAGEFPWHGAVFKSPNEFLCSCSFTPGSTCTTTASCVEDYQPSELKVVVGVYNKANLEAVSDQPPKSSVVKNIAFDPQYSSSTGKYDIAILHLKNNIDVNNYIKEICIDERGAIYLENNNDCVVTGWGNGTSKTLHYVNVDLLSEAECKKSVPGFDAEAMACGRPEQEVCRYVEFGSGLQCRDQKDRNKEPARDHYYLKGTYSGVTSCDRSQVMTFSTINVNQFNEALVNPRKFPLKG
uniref:CSON014387 protein n=1 Tax=Culicoides sonorensis TaxID=179676 RepID=A0A336KV48_CULSO